MAPRSLEFDELFDADFLNALQYFSMRLDRVPRGGRHADQKSQAHGQGLEFKDFKPYVAGDDLRAVDWNMYQRLGKVFVKVFEEHQDLRLDLLVDVSKSMFFGEVPRITAGLRTALGLSSISLGQHDSVGIYSFSDDMQMKVKTIQGRNNTLRVARHLSDLAEESGTDLSEAIRRFSSLRLRPGLLVVISDFFDPAGLEKVLESLKLTRHRLLLVQLTRSEDADPSLNEDLHGDVRLLDCETHEMADINISPVVLARYKEIYQNFNEQLANFARMYGAGFVQINADEDVLDQLSGLFATGSLVL